MLRLVRFCITAVVVIFVVIVLASLLGSFAQGTVTPNQENFGSIQSYTGLQTLAFFFAGWVGGVYAGGMVLVQVLVAIVAIVICALAKVDSRYGIVIAGLAAFGSGFAVLMTPLGFLLFVLEIGALLFYGTVRVLAQNGYGWNTGKVSVKGQRGSFEAHQSRFSPNAALDFLTPLADQMGEITDHLTAEESPAQLEEHSEPDYYFLPSDTDSR